MRTKAKICGLKTPEHVAAAVEGGAAYVGFVHFGKSSRHLELDDMRALAAEVPVGVAKVVLLVDADDATLDALCETVPVDMLQLHGAETPDRVAGVKARTGLPVMKAVGVADAGDVKALEAYMPVADQILVDAKPPKGASAPGGNGVAFDWRLIANRRWPVPWMLAGGLTPRNVSEAVSLTGAPQVDVSSGVETAPGQKDSGLIRAFLDAVP